MSPRDLEPSIKPSSHSSCLDMDGREGADSEGLMPFNGCPSGQQLILTCKGHAQFASTESIKDNGLSPKRITLKVTAARPPKEGHRKVTAARPPKEGHSIITAAPTQRRSQQHAHPKKVMVRSQQHSHPKMVMVRSQ